MSSLIDQLSSMHLETGNDNDNEGDPSKCYADKQNCLAAWVEGKCTPSKLRKSAKEVSAMFGMDSDEEGWCFFCEFIYLFVPGICKAEIGGLLGRR
ncbi:unnamed protein product [Owenia fusiformis]|uniref:Uncharacterized protein n=1 Tax=Owenia fusiformis TaxID=6347 RepID=A0A8S4Q6N0_OWEFU|nr:unnamed protein product [Owenia fusiformis]